MPPTHQLFITTILSCVFATQGMADVKKLPPVPESRTERVIEGWKVRIDERLLDPTAQPDGERILDSLKSRLSDICIIVPEPALGKLQGVTIVLDVSCGSLTNMQYHPGQKWLEDNGHEADLVKCVHIPVGEMLLQPRQTNVQPWVVLHELAHAYHDQVLGFDEKRIMAAYQKFKKSGRGKDCLLVTGNRHEHYGLTNQKEFFAEMTESYFGCNDFFPFNRGELKEHEPEILALMMAIWEPSEESQ
ncbi:MAG: metallopeptidase [Luteolibacter sp.]